MTQPIEGLIERLRFHADCFEEGGGLPEVVADLREAAQALSDFSQEGKVSQGASLTHVAGATATGANFQARVEPWMRETFGDVIPFDKVERADRLLEEVFELLQWSGYDPDRVAQLRDYTWSRPVGEGRQETGGVMVTLAAFCLAHGLDMHEAGEAELARVWTKVEAIRAKQAAKPRGIALPIGPLPPPPEPTKTEGEE